MKNSKSNNDNKKHQTLGIDKNGKHYKGIRTLKTIEKVESDENQWKYVRTDNNIKQYKK